MSKKVLKALIKRFKKEIVDSHDHVGDETILILPEHLLEIAQFLREDPKMSFEVLSDVTAMDYLRRKPRFEVVYHFHSLTLKHRVRVKVLVEEGQEVVPSLVSIWRSANWGEREVWDMFGIRFEGHPDLRRILMYEEFQGFPLRKDYPVQQSQPRMDLRARERDALEEYKTIYRDRGQGAQ